MTVTWTVLDFRQWRTRHPLYQTTSTSPVDFPAPRLQGTSAVTPTGCP